eukprot:8007833-Heterocapsa_arctica.AAC.1
MQEMTTNIRTGNVNIHNKGIRNAYEIRAGYILCLKPCILQEYHDNKWKDRNKGRSNHIDIDEEHKGPLAENIDYKRGSPEEDTIALGKANIRKRHLDMPTGGNCEPSK